MKRRIHACHMRRRIHEAKEEREDLSLRCMLVKN
jgi:hypothetical protein